MGIDPAHSRDASTERRTVDEDLRILTTGARCILWHADVWETPEPLLRWDLKVWDEEAARRFLPIEVPRGLTFVQAWYESREPEDRARMDDHGCAEIRAGRGYRQEFRCHCQDGEVRWLAEEVQVEPLAPGHWRCVGVCMDVTERKQVEAALRERELEERHFSAQLTRLQTVVNQLSKAASLDELCRQAVEQGCRQLGFDRLGLWFVNPDLQSATGSYGVDESGEIRDERGQRVRISPGSVAGQVVMSGRPFVLREDVPVLDHHAEPVGHGAHAIAGLWNGEAVIGFISTDNLLTHQPITERHCTLLSLYATALGHLCALKRLEEELRRRAEELSEADRRKDEFLAVLAHELRNPLTPILNATEMLRLRGDSEPHRVRAQAIVERQAQSMARLVNDLLDVSRLTQGKVDLRRERVELTGIVREALESVRPLMAEQEQILGLTVPSEPLWLEADPMRVEQILINLLHNAVKYTEARGRIAVTVERHNATAVLRVTDTGIGISPELLPRVFDLFTQADRSLDRSQGGLGIGLTMVQRLVQMHGGSVEAFSTGPGCGSEFVVRLPALPSQPAVPDPTE